MRLFIDEYAFNDCIYLMHITYEGSYEEYLEINTNIYGNDSLRNEGIKVEYEAIESELARDNYDYSFIWAPDGQSFYVYGIWNLENTTTLIIPEFHKGIMVTGIADYAFVSRSEITTVFIPWTISVVGENAFAECNGIKSVKFEGTEGDWANITINSGNNLFIKAEMEYEVTADNICDHPSKKVIKEVAPTADSSGYTEFACDDCGKSWIEEIPPLGGGDSEDVVKSVSYAEELVALIAQINSGEVANDVTIRLEDNIDMEGLHFTPIYEFRGTIDGNGKKISNIQLTENGSTETVNDGGGGNHECMVLGFISRAYDVTVRDLTLESVTANISTGANIYIGALAGYADGLVVQDCTITSVMVLTETNYQNSTGVSGVIGYSLDALLERVTVDTDVTHTAQSGESHTGAILGAGNVRIHDCTIDLAVTFIGNGGAGHAGWLIGREYTDASVDCATLQGSTVRGTFAASDCMYTWGAVGQGYLYIRHGEQIDLEANNKLINDQDVN